MNVDELLNGAIKAQISGNYKKAINLYEKIISIKPDHFYALHYLGVSYLQMGDFDIAIEFMEKALYLNSNDAGIYYNLGVAYQSKGILDKAIKAYLNSIKLNPKNTDAYVNVGIIFKETGRIDEAIDYYRKALYLNPEHVAALYNLGYALQIKRQFDEAIACYQKAVQINPKLIAAYQNLGCIYQDKGLLENGIECFQRVLQIDPLFLDAYIGLGMLFHAKGLIEDAMACFRTALKLKADCANAYYGIGIILNEIGKQDDAMNFFKKAIKYSPNFIQAKWAHCMSHLKPVYQDETSIYDARERYKKELLEVHSLCSSLSRKDIESLTDAVGTIQPFYLTAQGLNNKDLQRIYGEIVCKTMALTYPKFAKLPMRSFKSKIGPLKVGFVSRFFNWHSVWKIPLSGWIKNLDNSKFLIYGYHTGRKKDNITYLARHICDKFVEDIYSFEKLCEIIYEDNLDILIYPEIGMDPVSLKLAALRLAPVQCSSLGHPDTTGLPTIDYYLSSDLMEPPDAEQHYTEKLVRLTNLGFFYEPFKVSNVKFTREDIGLKESSVIFLCSHSLFTHLPQYDLIYPRIAAELKDCHFVFIAHKYREITEKFYFRIKKVFKHEGMNADKYVKILPRLDQERYHMLNKLSDVFLDTIGWSANNSTFEAIFCNLPIVTFPGNLMRQRHCAGILSMMGLTETVASSIENYIDIAVRLGRDKELRRDVAERIMENKHKIYCDKKAIRAFESFLLDAIKSVCS